MADNGISIQQAMAKWHLTQAQAEQLDKMDDDSDNGAKGNGKISGSIYDMAKTYYEESYKDDNAKEANRPQLFNDLVSWIKETKEIMKSMKTEAKNNDIQNKPMNEDDIGYYESCVTDYKNGHCPIEELNEIWNLNTGDIGYSVEQMKKYVPEFYKIAVSQGWCE